MKSLIHELEQATEGSRELDAKITAELRILPETAQSWMHKEYWGFAPHPSAKPGTVALMHSNGTPSVHWEANHYTTSLDAALTLVPEMENSIWDVTSTGTAWVQKIDASELITGKAASPALALCIAALKAREQADG